VNLTFDAYVSLVSVACHIDPAGIVNVASGMSTISEVGVLSMECVFLSIYCVLAAFPDKACYGPL
jgi:hypothetical protein